MFFSILYVKVHNTVKEKKFFQKFKRSISFWEPYLCSIFNSIQRFYVKTVNLKLIGHNIFNPYVYLGKNVSYLYMIITEYENENLQYFQIYCKGHFIGYFWQLGNSQQT